MNKIVGKRLPNFLIVGAAKSGSSSLYKYLDQHPQVFMSPKKEPLYFISEVVKSQTVDPWIQNAMRQYEWKWYVDNFEDYCELFDGVDGEVAIGEASATYLYYHKVSIPKIKEELGDVKIIIILRNPVKKAFSQYNYIKSRNAETLSFKQGIESEKERILSNYNSLYHYISQGLYYSQVKAFCDNFTNVKVILLNDLSSKREQTLKSVYKYLSVDDKFILEDKEVYNITGYVPKYQNVSRLLNLGFVKKCRNNILSVFPRFNYFLKKQYLELNSSSKLLSNQDKIEIYRYFKEDILNLEEYLDIDLSAWKYE